MKCIAPIRSQGAKYWVPCGRCGYCLSNRRNDWTFRLQYEFKRSYWSEFVTLTYDEASLPEFGDGMPIIKQHYGYDSPSLQVSDLQEFVKRVRWFNDKQTSRQLRYYACGEYGSKRGRPHYHVLFFNLHPKTKYKYLQKAWSKGLIDVSTCESSHAVAAYVAKYVINRYDEVKEPRVAPFSIMSLRPAIGAGYVDLMKTYHRRLGEPFVKRGESVQRLPRYIKEKIFSKLEREHFSVEGLAQEDLAWRAEMHRQTLLNGSTFDAWDYQLQQRQYHNDQVKSKVQLIETL